MQMLTAAVEPLWWAVMWLQVAETLQLDGVQVEPLGSELVQALAVQKQLLLPVPVVFAPMLAHV